MRRIWEIISSIACIVGLVCITIYAFVTISTLTKQKNDLIYQYNSLMQDYQEVSQTEQSTTLETEEEVSRLFNAYSNIDSITWEEAQELDIRDEYIQNQVSILVNKLGYAMMSSNKYEDKREKIEDFIGKVDALENEIGRNHTALQDARDYGKYLLKIFR